MRVEERLLKYVSYWTTSDEECRQIPSSERQFELGKVLEQELRDLGLEKVTLTDHCYVYGLLPATKGYADKPAVGFISHMDTAPDFSGKDVKPQIIPDYDGNDVLLKGSGAYLKISDFPTLKTLKGRTLITTDGTTLLGADDKAGVSEIMTAVEQIITEKIPHGDIWIGFTPDEEVGSGADLFDLDYFKAKFAMSFDRSGMISVFCHCLCHRNCSGADRCFFWNCVRCLYSLCLLLIRCILFKIRLLLEKMICVFL